MKRMVKRGSYFLGIVIVIGLTCCGTKKTEEVVSTNSSTAGFNSILFNVQGTSIKGGSADSVERLDKRFESINLTGTEAIWPAHDNFFLHAMGSLNFPDSGNYTFRLSSSGKIVLRLNNVDLFNIKTPTDTVKENNRVLEKGMSIFEFEYYDGGLSPKIVLEWSKDGQNFEVIPSSAFSIIDLNASAPKTASESPAEDESKLNSLTPEERKDGWKLLFDGKTTTGWHRYNEPGTIGSKWVVENGTLTFVGRDRFRYVIEGRTIEMGDTHKKEDGGVDIATDQSFGDFELKLEWKISPGGNSGIFYTVKEDPQYDEEWKTSPEMQVLDDQGHKDGLIYKHRSGDLYDLIACNPVTVKPQGEWNKVRVVKKKGAVEHWLNDVKVVEYNINSDEWTKMIKTSKFKDLKEFATSKVNKIGLQDHDNRVSFRNIKIKELK